MHKQAMKLIPEEKISIFFKEKSHKSILTPQKNVLKNLAIQQEEKCQEWRRTIATSLIINSQNIMRFFTTS